MSTLSSSQVRLALSRPCPRRACADHHSLTAQLLKDAAQLVPKLTSKLHKVCKKTTRAH